MNHTEFGFLLLTIAGLMNASFTLPMKFTRRWAWENTWLVWTIFALLLLPAAVTLSTVPELVAYIASPASRRCCALWPLERAGTGSGVFRHRRG